MNELVLTDNAAAITRQLQELPERMGRAIAAALDGQNYETSRYAQLKKLTGPRPQILGVVTNRLRGSLAVAPAQVQGDTVVSSIGTNVRYAGVHERGFEGPVAVRQHTRQVALSQTTSRHTFDMASGRVSKGKGKTRQILSQVTVRAHERHMKMPARPFISSSVEERRGEYGQAISTAIVTAWDQEAEQ